VFLTTTCFGRLSPLKFKMYIPLRVSRARDRLGFIVLEEFSADFM
jgi:hypothetical protein